MNKPAQTDTIEKQRLYGLDHLRSLAIIMVFLFHYQMFGHPEWESSIAGFGWTGVDLFFVLSGFLIARELFTELVKKKSISLKRFVIKRFFRIIPPYLVIVILYSLFPLLWEGGQISPLWRFLTFTLNFGLDRSHYQTFTHAWSLCIEEQFYLVLPVCLIIGNHFKIGKLSFFIIPALIIAGILLRLWSYNHYVLPYSASDLFSAKWYEFIYYPTYNRLDGLLIGVGIAATTVFLPGINKHIDHFSNVLLLAGFAMLAGAYFLCQDHDGIGATLFGFPLVSLGFGCIVYAVISPSCIIYKTPSAVSSQLASLSYAIYLVHKIVIHLTQIGFKDFGIDTSSALVLAVCIVNTLLAALLMRWVIERPSFGLRSKILAKNS